MASDLDKTLRLPKALTLRMGECGEPNAYYHTETRTIFICYNLLTGIEQDLAGVDLRGDALQTAAWHAFVFSLIHEVGHALIDVLDVPVAGREEDVADQLSTYALLEEESVGVEAALNGASWFGARSHGVGQAGAFWDSHALDIQRYYNIVCWVYGSNPEALAHIPESYSLPLDRAVNCPHEYRQLKRYWDRTLAPFLIAPK